MNTFWCAVDAETAFEFWQQCKERKIADDDIPAKTALLMEIAKRHEGSSAGITKKSPDEFVKHLSKHYKKILRIKEEGDEQQSTNK